VEARHDLGKRQAGVDRTRAAVLSAARELVAAGGGSSLSVGAVARRAGVSRLTIYNRFGSRSELLRPARPTGGQQQRRRPAAAPKIPDSSCAIASLQPARAGRPTPPSFEPCPR